MTKDGDAMRTCLLALLAVLTTLIIAALLSLAAPTSAEPIEPSEIRVVDGDTIQVYNVEPNVRLVGFDAPETWKPDCDGERALGLKATARLRELVRGGGLDFEYIACSCPAGTQGAFACNYGRDCGTLRARGRDVGAILIAEGLAVPFACGATSCPRKPHPWCGPPR
jgi:endonuclease YncB( thermonuclease family)